MTLYAQRDDEDRLVVGPEKSNIVGAVPASMFTIEPVRVFAPTDDTDGTVPRLRFAGESEKTAREIVADLVDAQRGDEDREDRTEAEKWLEGYLAEHGESPSAEVKKAGSKALGVTDRTIKRAARSLKVEMRYVGRPPVTYWSLDPSSRDTGDPCMSEDVPTCPTYSDLRKRDVPTRADSELGHEDTHRVPTVPTSDSGATRDPCMSESGPTGPTGRDLHKQNGPTGADSQSGHAQTHSGPAGPAGVVVDLDTRRETHEVPSSTPSPAPRKNTPRTPPKWTDPQWGTVYLGTDGKAAPLERFSEWRLAGSPAIRVPEGVAS
jgi:hypothetical protein